MKKLLIVVMACYGLNASAQVDESKNFIYLYSDSITYARNIRLRPDFFNSLQLRVDSRRIPLEQVKFFNNEDGFFANTRKLNFAGATEFSERIVQGRINLFQQLSYDPSVYDRGYGYRKKRQSAVDIRMFYNKGFGDLKKVSYNNLKLDMADHPKSIDLLAGYKKSINTSKILYVAAGASVAAGLISFLAIAGNQKLPHNDGFNTPNSAFINKQANFTASFALLGLGLGFAIGGYSVGVSADRHLEDAVDAYNR